MKSFWGDIEEITCVTAALGETGGSAGYKVCGASARGWLCRGKNWDHVYTNWALDPERASHLQHILGWGRKLELNRFPLAVSMVLLPPADRKSCVLVSLVLTATTPLSPTTAHWCLGERCRLWSGWRMRVRDQFWPPKVPMAGPSYCWESRVTWGFPEQHASNSAVDLISGEDNCDYPLPWAGSSYIYK